MHVIWMMLGASLGALCRYALFTLFEMFGWPLVATSLVNGLGCLAAGLFVSVALDWSHTHHELVRCFLMIGFLGSFTTFSAFSLDLLTLSRGAQWGTLSLHLLLNVGGSWIAVLIGYHLGINLVSRALPL